MRHVLFVHQNFPAQFGHVARYLTQHQGYQCTFASERATGNHQGIQCLRYQVRGGARATNHYCSRTFENAIWHTHAVYETLKSRPDIQPDLTSSWAR